MIILGVASGVLSRQVSKSGLSQELLRFYVFLLSWKALFLVLRKVFFFRLGEDAVRDDPLNP